MKMAIGSFARKTFRCGKNILILYKNIATLTLMLGDKQLFHVWKGKVMKRKGISGKQLCAGALATVLGLSPIVGDAGLLTVEAAGVSNGAGSYSTEIVGQYSYGDGAGNTIYVNNSNLAAKLPYVGSAYRYTTDNYNANYGAFDTTNWATSFMWDLNGTQPYSSQVYAFPLAFKGENYGLQVTAPSSLSDTANKVYTMQMAENGSITDFYIKAGFTAGSAKVDAVTDWSYDIIWENSSNSAQKMKATLVQGIPFAYFQMEGTNQLTVERGGKSGLPSAVISQSDDGKWVVVRCFDNGDNDYDYYAFYAAQGTNWDITATSHGITSMVANMPSGKEYVSMAYLGSVTGNADDEWAIGVAKEYAAYAYNFVTDTKATYSYDESTSTVTTKYTYTFDKKAESTADGTVMGILPHQYKSIADGTNFADYTYQTIRGKMKTIVGSSFTTDQTYSGILPYMPEIEDEYNDELSAYLDEYLTDFGDNYFANYEGCGDTYWDGKGLNRLANAMVAAEDAGDTETAAKLLEALKSRLENWLTYTGSNDDAYFFYDDGVGSLFGFPQSYSSVDQMNDHHFHYGYFIYAAAQVAMRVDNWGDDNQYGAMVKELIYDIACPERNNSNSRYPYLRAFAPYEGHSWASGHQNFGMGNNQESSSEALNAWAGIILFGEAIGDDELRDLGVYLYTTEVAAVNNYWFDVDEDVLSDAYRYGVPNAAAGSIDKENTEVKLNSAAIVWGGSYCYATWFSANPLHIQGINLLPMNPTGFYLAGDKDYIEENIRLAYKYAAEGGFSQTEWIDIWCQYQALADPEAAFTKWEAAEAANYGVEGGETKAHTYHFIRSLCRYGTPDTTITGDCALSTVFVKDGVKTYAAYNASDDAITVRFSDGASITVAANSMYAGANGTGNGEAGKNQATYKVQYYQQNLAQNGYELVATSSYKAEANTTVNVETTNASLAKEYVGFDLNKTAAGTTLQGTVSADGSLVLKLYYDRETYGITYNTNGGTNASNPSSYVYGSNVTLADATKDGYYFAGWYTDAACTEKITSITSTTTGDITVYAKWTEEENGGSPIISGDDFTYSNGVATFCYEGANSGIVYIAAYDTQAQAEEIAAKANAAAPGFEHVVGHGGYMLNANGNNATADYAVAEGKYLVYAFNPDFAGVTEWKVGATQENGSTDPIETYAAYTVKHYVQNTALNGYDVKDSASAQALVGETVSASANDYTGFTYDAAASKVSGTVLEDGSLELALYYNRDSYAVQYMNVDGAQNANAATYVYGVGMSLADASKDGYIFGGWYSDANLTNAVTAISADATGTQTVYAKWNAKEAEVTPVKGDYGFTFDKENAKATFYYKGAGNGIVYVATYDTLAQAEEVAAKANAAAPGFEYVTGHGGYMLNADGDYATADYAVEEGKYVVYAFNPDFKGVTQWYVGTASETVDTTTPVTGGEVVYDATTGNVTITCEGASNGIVYVAVYDSLTQAEEIVAKANAAAPGFEYVTGHGGYMLNADGDAAKATVSTSGKKYVVYAFNPDFAGVQEWKLFSIE